MSEATNRIRELDALNTAAGLDETILRHLRPWIDRRAIYAKKILRHPDAEEVQYIQKLYLQCTEEIKKILGII